MLINSKELDHWVSHFYGYGTWHAPFWFVAYEDGGGELPEEVSEKFTYFYSNHPTAQNTLCDIRDMYKHIAIQLEGPRADLYHSLFDFRFGSKAVQHGIWKNLISFAHGFKNHPLPDLLDYQRNQFVRSNEALIQLYPLPSPHNHAWYYSWLDMPEFPFLKSRKKYESFVFQFRINNILNNIASYKPEVVLMYGMDNIQSLKDSVSNIFPDSKFETVKATKQIIPQHHRAEVNGTMILITTQIPTLRHNRVGTGFDWEALGKLVNTKA